jgi:TRAP-type mannitol/chloroaromatic compound transport system substrate-binding protein
MNLNALQELKEGKTEVLEFPADVMAELHRLSFETLEEEAAKDPDFKKVYDAYQAFRKRNDEWNAISDTAYERLSREAKR